ATLHRRLTNRVARLPFVSDAPGADAVAAIMDHLDRGQHVVLEFGRHGDDVLAYMLVANLLTRRIHDRYRERQTAAEEGRNTTPLTIVIEEAHRFLSPTVASQSPFGVIAREMRKNNVTLLVVDQRPSAIDPEVLSQVGTKVCCLLDDERDVDAVMAGASGSRELRSVLAGLRSRQQALFFGEAVPIPVAVQVRDYGTESSYDALMRPRSRRPAARPDPVEVPRSATDDEDDDPLFG
ncbi:MAG: ATP-binding protein, partial [Chloroflexota bacterium]|nr:ATP-binding protein [Chloroflexota bacterium]